MSTSKIFDIKILGYVKLLLTIELGMCVHILVNFYFMQIFRYINPGLDLCIHLLLALVHPKEIDNRLFSSTNMYILTIINFTSLFSVFLTPTVTSKSTKLRYFANTFLKGKRL